MNNQGTVKLRFFILLSLLILPIACHRRSPEKNMAPTPPPNLSASSSVAERARSWKEHTRLAETSPFRDLQWQSLGPRKQGGRIETIACPPGYTSTIYVGAGSGNIWKTINNGTTWKPIFDNESTFAIGDIAVDPTNPETLWVGTGEVLMARSSYAGTGVFKSLNGGETWTNMGLRDTHHIGRVLVDPRDSDTVYVAAIGHLYSYNKERGVFKTTDGGKTWEKILFIDERTGAIDLVMDPLDSRILYASMMERDRKAWGHKAHGEQCAIHKSTDGGRTWKRLAGGFPQGEQVGRIGLDVAPSNPHILYATVDCLNEEAGVYRSADKGKTWAKVNRQKIRAGYDFCEVRVSPDDENEIYIPGVRSYVSKDGGETYRQIEGTLVHLLEHGSKILHLDAHALWIDPLNTNRLILGNDGGLHISNDRGESWLHLNNIPIAEFYAIGYDMATPYNIYGGTQDNAALYGPSTHRPADGEEDAWRHVYLDPWGGGDSYFTPPDPSDLNTIYYEHQFGALRRKNMKTGESKRINPKAAEGEPPIRTNWMTPFFISHYDSSTLYYGASRLYKSTNRGDAWTPISPNLTTDPGPERQGNVPYGTLTTLSESPLKQCLIYAGADDGSLHVTTDDGESWASINEGLPAKWVSRVIASEHDAAKVYVSLTAYREDNFTAYLYKSCDQGKTWLPIVGNLPAESVNVIREDPVRPGHLYVGTDLGVYVSLDDGAAWHSLCDGLPTTPVHDLFIHPREPELVIGTHGRSAFLMNIEKIRESR